MMKKPNLILQNIAKHIALEKEEKAYFLSLLDKKVFLSYCTSSTNEM